MMELRRLLDVHADPDVRRALRAGACLEPPPGSEKAVWGAIATALTVTAASGAAHAATGPASMMGAGAGAAGQVGLAGLAKSFAVGVGATVLALGGVAAIQSQEKGALAPWPASSAVGSNIAARDRAAAEPAGTPIGHGSAAETTTEEPRGEHVSQRGEMSARSSESTSARPPAVAAQKALRVGASRGATVAADPTSLAESSAVDESVLVLEARRALRGGDPSRTLLILERAKASFGEGALGQEREALEIEALVELGAVSLAKKRVTEFQKRFPESALVDRVRSLVE
jgi:hypothetical protein